MNKYLRAGVCASIGVVKSFWLKMSRGEKFQIKSFCLISPRTEITLDKGGYLKIGKLFKLKSGSKVQVRPTARVSIGDNVFLNNNCRIVSHKEIQIGDDVEFGPGVLVYDHDHDFRASGGLKANQYKTESIKIGNNVWIGANSIILRGTKIGDNCVVAAGSVVKGVFPENSLIYQQKETKVKNIVLGK